MTNLLFSFGNNNYSSVFDYVDNEEKWTNLINTVKSFGNLQDNWDGEGSLAPREDVIRSLLNYLFTLKNEKKIAPPDRATTTDEGGIAVEWQLVDGVAELETEEPGAAEIMFALDDGETTFELLRWDTEIENFELNATGGFYSGTATTTPTSLYIAA